MSRKPWLATGVAQARIIAFHHSIPVMRMPDTPEAYAASTERIFFGNPERFTLEATSLAKPTRITRDNATITEI